MKKVTLLLNEDELLALRSSLLTAETDFKSKYCHDCNEDTFVNPHKNIRERVDELYALSLKSSDLSEDKAWYIERIKDIIQEYGELTNKELETESDIVIESSDELRTVIERFDSDYAGVVTYTNNENAQLSESDILYENLDEDTLEEIHALLYDYEVGLYKTFKRCEN
jgi:hypothetical protein